VWPSRNVRLFNPYERHCFAIQTIRKKRKEEEKSAKKELFIVCRVIGSVSSQQSEAAPSCPYTVEKIARCCDSSCLMLLLVALEGLTSNVLLIN
jgi:hypothetical protein